MNAFFFWERKRIEKKEQRGQKKEGGREERKGEKERGHTAHKSPRGSRRYKTIDPSPNGISELDPLNVVIEFGGNMKVS